MIEVSVVIPMYNSEDTIIECLNSVLHQSYKCKEIIIINDGSTDKSKSVVEEFIINNNLKNKMKLITKKNAGVSSARNTGLKIVSGNYIALLDSDDVWLPNKLQKQIDVMINNQHIDFLGCNRNNEITKIYGKEIKTLTKVTLNHLLFKMFPQTSTAFFKAELLESIGYYDEEQTHAEDGNLWLRICVDKNFYMMPESLVITGGGKPSFGFSGLSANIKAMHRGCLKNFKEMYDLRNINYVQYILSTLYEDIKYIRRVLLVIMRG
ncbi:glycosyltransferase family 2 protein [Clostridium sp.]|uniref:glycosyltransferase family 2 protein n=1 Tax=Clostridium sp. TaxID=1506 RepID=UPI003D6CF89B